MGVRIDEINVEKAGPISELHMRPGLFNLVYGRNEQGKTFLVEFLIRSLFKNLGGWSLRHSDGRGKVVVSGLGDGALSLMPSSSQKIEHYLAQTEPGLPARISRLLVVKGAELGFDEGAGPGVSPAVFKEFLSGQGVLDDIQTRISKTVQGAKLVNGRIEGHQRGEISRMNEAAARISALDQLFEQIEINYSGGERQSLQARISELENEIQEQEAARRHQAYLIATKLDMLQSQFERLPEAETEPLADEFKEYRRAQADIGVLESRVAELAQKSEHYEWLEQAIPVYEQRGGTGRAGRSITLPLLILPCLLLAIIASFFDVPLATLALILFATVLGWLYWRQLQAAIEHALDVDEIRKLEAEFERRIGRPLSGLPMLQESRKKMAEAYHGSKTQRENVQELQKKAAALHDQIAARLRNLTAETADPERWEEMISALLSQQRELRDAIGEQKLALASLGVAESDYLPAPAEANYDPERLQRLQQEAAQLKESLKEKTAALDNLKYRICQETKDPIATEWAVLIQNLQRRRETVVANYRSETTQVLAGILVNQALGTIRAQENEKIQQKLASPEVSTPIQRITRRYTGVRYENGHLTAVDAYGGFPMNDLSTGAREQVLLGLRLGFASQLLGQDRLFLLLDDAFQHADWQRRPWLVDQLVRLANDGWQIMYFTMDDHIKGLFNTAGQSRFGDQYCYYELAA